MNDNEWADFKPVEISPEVARRNIEAAGGRVTSTRRPTWIKDEVAGGPQSQERLHNLYKAGKGNPAAAPGHGRHETDDAIDFVGDPSTAGVPFKRVFWENDHYHGEIDRPSNDWGGFTPVDKPAPAAAPEPDRRSTSTISDLITGKAPDAAAPAAAHRDFWTRFKDNYSNATETGMVGYGIRRLSDLLDLGKPENLPPGMTPEQAERIHDKAIIELSRQHRAEYEAKEKADPTSGIGGYGAMILGNILGGADPTYLIGGPGGKGALNVAKRILTQAGVNGGVDAVDQGLEVAEGTRDNFDPKEVALNALAGGVFQGGGEAIAKGVRSFRERGADTGGEWDGFEEVTPPARGNAAPEAHVDAQLRGDGVMDASTMTPEQIAADKAEAARLEATFNDPNDHTKPAIGEVPEAPPLTSRESFDDTAQLMSRFEDERLPNETREDYVRRKTAEETALPVEEADALGNVANDIAATTDQRAALGDRRTTPREDGDRRVPVEESAPLTKFDDSDIRAVGGLHRLPIEELKDHADNAPAWNKVEEGQIDRDAAVTVHRAASTDWTDANPDDMTRTLSDIVIRQKDPQWVRRVSEDVGSPEEQADFITMKKILGEFKRQGTSPGDLSANLVEKGWSKPDADEVVGHRMDNLQQQTTPRLANDPVMAQANESDMAPGAVQTLDPEAEYRAQNGLGGSGGGEPPVPPTGGGEPPMDMPTDPDKRGFAGNINLDRIKSNADIDALYRDLSTAMPTNADRHQGRKATEELAASTGMSPEELIKHNPKLVEAPQYAVALRNHLRAAAARFFEVSRKVADGDNTQATMRDLLLAQARTAALMERTMEVAGVGGRLLDSHNIMAKGGGAYDKLVKAIPNEMWSNPDNAKRLAKMVTELAETDPDAAGRLAKDSLRPRAEEYLFSAWYNWGLLSGLKTHATNVVSNALNILADLGEHGLASAFGQARRGSKNGDRVMAREVLARLYGMGQGLANAWPNMKQAFLEGAPLDQVVRMERPHIYGLQRDAEGKPTPSKGAILAELSTRAMAAEDEFFRTIASMMELYGLGWRNAAKEGLGGKALVARANELARNPTDEMLLASNDAGLRLRFQDAPSGVGKAIENLRSVKPDTDGFGRVGKGLLRVFIPFIRSPDSLFRTAIRRSLFGPFDRYNIADWKAGGARRDIAMARVSLGTAVTAYAAMLALDDGLTGAGPADYKKAQEKMPSGWRPNSVRGEDGSYTNIKGYEPLSTNFTAVASIVENVKNGKGANESNGDVALRTILDVARALNDNNWSKNITDTLSMLDRRSGNGKAANAVAGIASSTFVPAIVRQVNQDYIDPVKRDTRGDGTFEGRVTGRIQSGIPGLSKNLPVSYDTLGRPVKNPDAIGPDALSRLEQVPSDPDPVSHEIDRLAGDKILVGPVGPNVRNQRLKPADYQRYQQRAGTLIHDALSRLMRDPGYRAMSDEEKRAEIKSTAEELRKQARDELFPKEDE